MLGCAVPGVWVVPGETGGSEGSQLARACIRCHCAVSMSGLSLCVSRFVRSVSVFPCLCIYLSLSVSLPLSLHLFLSGISVWLYLCLSLCPCFCLSLSMFLSVCRLRLCMVRIITPVPCLCLLWEETLVRVEAGRRATGPP